MLLTRRRRDRCCSALLRSPRRRRSTSRDHRRAALPPCAAAAARQAHERSSGLTDAISGCRRAAWLTDRACSSSRTAARSIRAASCRSRGTSGTTRSPTSTARTRRSRRCATRPPRRLAACASSAVLRRGARAFATTGDMLAEEPACSRQPAALARERAARRRGRRCVRLAAAAGDPSRRAALSICSCSRRTRRRAGRHGAHRERLRHRPRRRRSADRDLGVSRWRLRARLSPTSSSTADRRRSPSCLSETPDGLVPLPPVFRGRQPSTALAIATTFLSLRGKMRRGARAVRAGTPRPDDEACARSSYRASAAS